ncbi:MAG: hypothetical protein A3F47_02010 [Candidatus Staskawiczbacteria bacterium RIFCSPHIGHO2_12_FULL_38_11]|uniref:Uncharacterized protein n=1 Tax=Candidatus Staskawiczbacteria bacterium RIFCSPHIGHO2_12_FULL_38_11 TaxID=1802209 RepID=A0A1G2I4Q2_9BACT|nr:MAG: hypothetical protein A3F47_02010 [Candidatus Staskawiczbacteria bacterium RIFCSPHIGHO2_12_FULL_38_11]
MEKPEVQKNKTGRRIFKMAMLFIFSCILGMRCEEKISISSTMSLTFILFFFCHCVLYSPEFDVVLHFPEFKKQHCCHCDTNHPIWELKIDDSFWMGSLVQYITYYPYLKMKLK